MRAHRIGLAVLTLFFLTAAAVSTAGAAEPAVPEKVKSLLQDRKYPEAVTAIDEAAAAENAPKDYLRYLKGRALHLQTKYDEAIAVYDSLGKDFPKSEWARRSRFGKAVSLMRKGDFRAAELIYREEAGYLLSTERKGEIAGIYLEFADAYFKPKDEQTAPNYQKALEFYQKALEVGPKPEKRAEIELLVARCFQALGNHQEAANRYAKFIKDYPSSALVIEARYRLGEAQLALNQPAEARRTWQDLLTIHADSKSDRVPEAAYNLSQTYGLPAPANDEALSLGVGVLENFLKKYPSHKLAPQAHLRIAASYMHRSRHDKAIKLLDEFTKDDRYLKDETEQADAWNLLGRAYQLQKKFPEALAAWQTYLRKFPAHSAWSEVQRQIVTTEYLLGAEKRRAKAYDDARKLWTEFMAKHPLDDRTRAIMYEFGLMNYLQEKYDDAIADWKRLVSKYPGSNESSQAQYMIGVTLETQLGKLDEALKEFKKVTWGNFTSQAQAAAARLTAKTLAISTTRTYRTDEKARIKLQTRNVDSVTVRAYTVDLETYFRKMHNVQGVEGLDIALIDPDRSFEYKVPKYAEHQLLESEIEIPLGRSGEAKPPASGVMAVTVSSKTLEATTLVVQSDLDIIVKSSRDEVFVFAQNMRTGKPWAKARVLVSNGQQIIAEGVTGDDGVLQKSVKELKEAGDVRVFALADGSVASNVVGLEGVGVAQGLADKGYIYTDRPAYRAGQMVHVRGILRRVIDDAYTIEKAKKYTAEVFDVRNRQVWQEDVKLSNYGTFHLNFVLPLTSPAGNYRVLVRDDENRTHQGAFTVHEYQLDPVRLFVETPRKVFYRGEEIEGKIVARYYYGAPLVGREVRYQLAGGPVTTAKTDAKGEIHFKLATRDFRESQVLPLTATLAERNLQSSTNFFLATQGYALSVTTVRPVYVSGESFEVTVKALDAEGQPVAQKLTLDVLEQTVVEGKVGEKSVEKHEITTGKDGLAKQVVKLAKGANFVLRAEGVDQFKNDITGQHIVQVSDDEDTVRLRILAEKHTFKLGDEGTVQVHWREEPALALVTFQGAKVLEYRLVDLKKGVNTLKIPMTDKLAPNFELAVAVMVDNRAEPKPEPKVPGKTEKPTRAIVRFHEAASNFAVERSLIVKVETKRKGDAKGPIRPGEEVSLVVKATDPQGKPVVAELTVAMIEQALLDRFGSNVEAVQDFFRGVSRVGAMRQSSSVTFSYAPTTRSINSRLLAEAERREIDEAEKGKMEKLAERMATDSFELTSMHDARVIVQEEDDRINMITGEVAEASLPYAGQPAGGVAFGLNAPNNSGLGANVLNSADQQQIAQGKGLTDRRGFKLSINKPQLQLGAGLQGQGINSGDNEAELLAGNSLHAGWNNPAGNWDDNDGQSVKLVQRFNAPQFRDENGDQIVAVANTGNLNRFWANGQNDVMILNVDGSLGCVNFNNTLGFNPTAGDLEKLAKQLSSSGAVILNTSTPSETAFWNPTVVTDSQGEATLTLTMPDMSTAWRIIARGIDAGTLAGEADQELIVKKDLFAELRVPAGFTEGDEAEVLVTIHNDAVEKGQIEVTLKTTIAGKSVDEKKTIDVTAKGQQELTFKINLKGATAKPGDDGVVLLEVTTVSGEQRDLARRSIGIRPFGLPVYATAGGVSSSDTTIWVEPPKDMPFTSPTLQIIVGPSVEHSLLDIVLGPAPSCQLDLVRMTSGLDAAVSDLMASVALQKLISASRDSGNPQAQSLDARIRSSLSLLISSQKDDGGWTWTGHNTASHGAANQVSNAYASARVVWALSLAKAAGYKVPDDGFEKAKNFLRSQIAAGSETDYENKAILLHALSAAGQGDFTLANRLYRNRPALSNAALAHLALAFLDMDRAVTAKELLDLLATRDLDATPARRLSLSASLPWNNSSTELRALYALALQRSQPQAPKTKELVDWLMAHRSGHRWAPDKATGPAALALVDWFSKNRSAADHYKVAILVNDKEVKTIEISKDSGTQIIDVPATVLAKEGKQRVNFRLEGRGRFTHQTVLASFVPADKLKSTIKDWTVKRHYEPAPQEFDGVEVPRGFGILQGAYETFRNPLTQLPVGKRGTVELNIWRANVPANTPQDYLEYLVVTEPLPSGVTVVENSIRGGFERYELAPGSITFYIGSRQSIDPIHFDVHGYVAGQYRAGPTVIRNAYRADQMAVSESKSLTVLPLGGKSDDVYRLSPQELFELGKRHFAKKSWKEAGGHLADLINKWNLNAETYKETARMLLDVHLETGPSKDVVRYFEILKEKWSDLELPFEKIVKVGIAYDELGEYERSFLVFRATVESSFQRESAVAGFLDAQGEFLRSVDVMGRLLLEYPPEPYVAAATYALAQQVYAKAPSAAADAKLRDKKITRVDLVQRALAMLDNFLTAYPEDPAADQAAFSLANALLELKAYKEVIAKATLYAERYKDSEFLDSFWYIVGYGHFALGQHEEALKMSQKVAESKRLDKTTGREVESPNKWQAIYILGQVYHSLGKAAEAITAYTKVEDRFVDARQAIAYFLRKEITLPEVTTIRPGDKADVELKFRNMAKADLKVYRIDLMKFSLLKRNLAGITQINLSGIRPTYEAQIELGDGQDYRDRTKQLDLPIKDEGAYLVVVRGDDLHASGLVLVSPLVVEVQEEQSSGRVRVTVKDVVKDRYLPEVHAKVIGSRNADFVSGHTDLRGVFVSDGIQGTSTVIAQGLSGRYAFFRGKLDLGPPPVVSKSEPAAAQKPGKDAPDPKGQSDGEALLDGLNRSNSKLLKEQQQQLKQLYDNKRSGVQAKEAF